MKRFLHTLHPNQVLLTMIMLSALGLINTVSANDVYHSGEQYGIWTVSNSPYLISGDIIVPHSRQLTIEPGVSIEFLGNFHFFVNGLLIAEGEEEDSLRIKFFRTDSAMWQGVYFNNDADSRSRIINCDITNARIGIDLNQVSPAIRYNRIVAGSYGIYARAGSRPEISANILIRAGDNITQTSTAGIMLAEGSNAVIYSNTRIEVIGGTYGEAIGIMIDRSQPDIRDNWIEVRSQGSSYGIFTRRAENANIFRNIIRVRSWSEMIGFWALESNSTLFRNNNVILIGSSNEATGIRVGYGSNVTLQNNILLGNSASYGINSQDGEVSEESGYNNLWQHQVNYRGDWRGYEDVLADPMFRRHHENIDSVASDGYRLRWDDYPEGEEYKSPCIDAGVEFLNDPDETRSDIGRYYFHQEPETLVDTRELPDSHLLLSSYPNPFNSTTTISVNLPSNAFAKLTIIDVNGRIVQELWNGNLDAGLHNFQWQASGGTPSGLYLVRFTATGKTISSKIILLP